MATQDFRDLRVMQLWKRFFKTFFGWPADLVHLWAIPYKAEMLNEDSFFYHDPFLNYPCLFILRLPMFYRHTQKSGVLPLLCEFQSLVTNNGQSDSMGDGSDIDWVRAKSGATFFIESCGVSMGEVSSRQQSICLWFAHRKSKRIIECETKMHKA